MEGPDVRVRVLGPFTVETADGLAIPLGGPRQRAVLARLLGAGGEVVSVDRLIEDLWHGEPPPSALTSLQAYVSNLRRALEPGRPRRAPARHLVSAAPGYALRLPRASVDAWRFEDLVRTARAEHDGRALERALELWRGDAYAEFADESWAVAEAARLTELRLSARELSAELALRSGAAAEAAVRAEALLAEHPLREEAWRLLTLALWAAGRRADALAALRRVRSLLAEELGLDPPPTLTRLEEAILRGDEAPLAEAAVQDGPAPRREPPDDGAAEEPFLGREEELAGLLRLAEETRAGALRVALLSGEAGAGKSTLLTRLEGELTRRGWRVAVGRCPEAEGAPPAWAWVQLLRSLAATAPAGPFAERLAPLLKEPGAEPSAAADPAGERFRLHRAVCAWLGGLAGRDGLPLAVFLDDLHAADGETLALLGAVAAEVRAPLLLVAAYREEEIDDRFTEVLAALARLSPARHALRGLEHDDVGRLIGSVYDGELDDGLVVAVRERTGGNPFYVRESARLLASEGALVAVSEVPEGVRDVLRRRFSRLPAPAVSVLRLAAVAGREADVDVVVAAAETEEDETLDALEAGLVAGLLGEPEPGRIRFSHVLVRDTLYQDVSQLRRLRMHARLAEAIERLRPADLSSLAHHYGRAGRAGPAMEYALRAAAVARGRFAYDAEVELLTQAVEAHERLPEATDDRRVDLLGRLLRAQARAGDTLGARRTRDRAADVAERSGRTDLLVAAYTSWTEPGVWERRPYATVDERTVAALGRLLEIPDLTPRQRCDLLDALTAELPEDDPAAQAAGAEAVALARATGDPGLLAVALTAHSRVMSFEALQPQRALLAAELVEVSAAHGLPVHEWTGVYLSASAAGSLGDLEAMARHAARSRELARRYQLPEALAVEDCRDAMLAYVAGRFAESEAAYRDATARLTRYGSPHAESFLRMALVSLRLAEDRLAELEPDLRALLPYVDVAAEPLSLLLARTGRAEEARAVRGVPAPLPANYLQTFFLTLRSLAVVALEERDEAAALHDTLLPHRDTVPGAITASVALPPVAHALGLLARLLGRPDEAASHLSHALQIARRWNSPHWEEGIRRSLADL